MQNSLVNNVTLIGNLGAKPTVTNLDKDKKVQSENSIVRFII